MFSTVIPLLSTFAVECKSTFFGLVPWYQYLTLTDFNAEDASKSCRILNFSDPELVFGAQSPFLLIGLAILEDLIRIAALVAVGFVIAGGFQYMTGRGTPDSSKKALQTIINALVGVGIAIVAASAVAYLGRRLGA